jgi:DNA-binding NarL/FixJ family response regulator
VRALADGAARRDAVVLASAHESYYRRGSASGGLSPRESEVLALLAEGLSNREIGKRLFISEVTVKVHIRHIFEKLGVRTRTQAAIWQARRSS